MAIKEGRDSLFKYIVCLFYIYLEIEKIKVIVNVRDLFDINLKYKDYNETFQRMMTISKYERKVEG